MEVRLAAGMAAVVGVLALAPGAQAATVAVSPQKPCYRSGETIRMSGTGFTPGGTVDISSEGSSIGSTTADGSGNFGGRLQVASPNQRVKTYTATDQSNPANSASTSLTVSPLDVNIAPRNGPPGRRLRIVARGFTTGRILYAHVVRGRRRSHVRVGRLRGPCRRLRTRRRIFRGNTRPGTYVVQFDTRRRYSPDTRVRVRFRVSVFPVFGAGALQTSISG
ncbi:MAG TPA: hypothetical protein VHG69_13865 [Thermoleophilaceae bacterium]|nr:hypothetical protein [Thermoleophilaceae bacterium]